MKVLFLGRGELGYRVLKRLLYEGVEVPIIITCDHSPEVGSSTEAFRELAKNRGIEYYHDNNINTDEWAQKLKSYNAEIAVALLWLHIINEPTINTTKYGFLNFHAGDLPRYRGSSCSNWAIIQGEEKVGLCVHLMEPNKLDSGPIILKECLPLQNDTVIGDIKNAQFTTIGVELIVDAVEMFASGDVNMESQNDKEAIFCYPRLPQDGEINWDLPSEKIYALIRATGKPYPGAYTYYQDSMKSDKIEKVIIWEAHIEDHDMQFLATPGYLIKLGGGKRWGVATVDNKLMILDKIEIGGRIVDPAEIFRKSTRCVFGIDVSDEVVKMTEKVRDLERAIEELRVGKSGGTQNG